MINKRGQFYLVAAMIIIAVIIGIFGITNYAKKTNSDKEMAFLKNELDTEIGNNFEYISQNALTSNEINNLWINFSKIQISNLRTNKNILFIFGDTSSTTAKGSRLSESENLQIDVGNGFEQLTSEEGEFEGGFLISGTTIIIRENLNDYIFELEEGQHFYYLISKENKGEKVIIRG